MKRVVHPIEEESYRRLRARLDTSRFPPLTRAVVERGVHSAADLEYATDLVMDEGELEKAHAALHAGAPVVVDAEMVGAGITRRETVCRLRDAVAGPGATRSAHGMRLAYEQVGPGALRVIGNAPTALEELLTLDASPALVVGLPAVSNVSEKGGSAVAAAALSALLYHPASPEAPKESEETL
ncbi:precorrin-8X methylmutase [Streptomyces sp. NPDC003719]